MSIANDLARKLWNDIYGANTLWASDCFGTWIYRDDHGDYETQRVRPNGTGIAYNYGWDVDHIRPKADFNNPNDADFWNNYEPMHRQNNESKTDNFPYFEVKKRQYLVVKCNICSSHNLQGYGIIDVQTNQRVDWKGKKNQYYKVN
ncbi:MAG TPA: hypothetical protein PLP48_06565 [Acholeplasmataceae bacterium]|nr:hypothetical protein [Acholeplasmataceae bacterium]